MASPLPTVERIPIGVGRSLKLLAPIGRGAASVVYRAVLESNGIARLVAAKFFGAIASDECDSVLRALSLAASRLACVRHPNVVDVYEFSLWQGQPLLLSELVEGVSLSTLAARYTDQSRRVPLDVALFVATEVAEALSGARTGKDHDGMQLGVLHLGLSSNEILLSWRGEVKVSDFETNTARFASSSVRSLRAVAGRARTMAPEVARGQPGDARSDVFSLGVVLRELFVGPRFPKDLSDAEAITHARQGYVQPISFQPHLPEELVRILERCIEVEPEGRYPNASAVAFELRRVALALGVGDGRFFLRRLLDREFGEGGNEVTTEHVFTVYPPKDTKRERRVSPVPLAPVRRLPLPSASLVDASDLIDESDIEAL